MALSMSTLRKLGTRLLGKTAQLTQFSVTMLFAAAVTVLLLLGTREANRLQASSSALQLATGCPSAPSCSRGS